MKAYIDRMRAAGRVPLLGKHNQPVDPDLTDAQIATMSRQTGLPEYKFRENGELGQGASITMAQTHAEVAKIGRHHNKFFAR